ncbi:hypothetical protein V7S43_004326 [Phytophthora oleae]|uniref:GRIP domain-containing protein n=1 Tax=Phytophthora oleae TaxID=2107226 RepID=A0ABD3FW41_9STRA
MSFKMPPSLTIGTSIERSFSSSSLRSPAKGSASPSRTPQKSFGRAPARVAAAPVSPIATPAPVVPESEEDSHLPLSVDDTQFAPGLQQEIAQDLPPIEAEVDHEQENSELRDELDVLRQELRDLHESSSKNDEVWQRDNARLKEQLTAANAREAVQLEQLHIRDNQLTLCRQELRELQDHQLKVKKEQSTRALAEEAGSSGLGHERELLKLVVQLVGSSNVRAVLHENPNASPAQLREALVRLRCPQCQRVSPPPAKSTGSDSLHKMLFGTSARPPSPTAIRLKSRSSRSPK